MSFAANEKHEGNKKYGQQTLSNSGIKHDLF